MTPFMQLRRWMKDGPGSERFLTLIAGLAAVLLVAWAVLPTVGSTVGSTTGEASVAAGGAPASVEPVTDTAPTADSAPSAASPAVGSVDVAAMPVSSGSPTATPSSGASAGAPTVGPAKPVAASSTAGGPACDNRATDKGVSANQVLVGVIIYTLGEANPALGLPAPADVKRMYNAVFDRVNRAGGVGCRKLVARYYEEFVLDQSSGHASCLQMQQDGVFAVLNNFFTSQNRNCPMQAGIPNFWTGSPDTSIVRSFHPFVMSFQADYDRLLRDYVLGAHQRGWFNGMGKVGILEQTCFPERPKAIKANLARVGIGSDRISSFNYGCPTSATPDLHFQAVLQFRRDGVTHVLNAFREGVEGFASAAEQQNYHPKYALADDQLSSLLSNANPPWSSNLDGALIIEKSQDGAEHTPGATFSKATADCATTTKSLGLPPPTDPTIAGSIFALACIHTKMFVAAAKATTPLTRRGLAAGLATVGDVDLSYPAAPAKFTDSAMPLGAQFWRSSSYHADCTCVKLLDPIWRPEFR